MPCENLNKVRRLSRDAKQFVGQGRLILYVAKNPANSQLKLLHVTFYGRGVGLATRETPSQLNRRRH